MPPENADAVRAAMFGAGAGQIGDYSQCSWSVTGTGQFLPEEGASPAIGSIGSVERVIEDRVEVIAPASARPAVLAAMRAAHPYEEPAFDVFALAPLPGDVGLGRVGSLPIAGTVARVRSLGYGVRCRRRRGVSARRGIPTAQVSRVAVCGGAGDSLLDDVAARRCRRLRDRRPAPPPRRRAPAGVRRCAGRRRALGKRIPVVRPRQPRCYATGSVHRWRCACPTSVPTHGTSRTRRDESRCQTNNARWLRWSRSTPSCHASRIGAHICPSCSDTTRCRPNTVPPMIGWPRCNSRWRT